MPLTARLRPTALGVAACMVAASCVLGAVVAPAGATNDPLFAKQWGLAAINAPGAWSVSTGKGVVIGVVDSGIDLSHEDLAAKIVATTNCVGSNGDPAACHGTGQDDVGHGTHVAGIAAAVTSNGKGIAGVAPDSRLLVAKAIDSTGSGTVDDINGGIRWVVDHGARVVNLSLGDSNFLGTSLFGTTLSVGIEYAWSHGAVPVLAAGNQNFLGLGSSNYGSLHAIVVGAVGRDGSVAGYSSPTGDAKWAVVAPGGSHDGTPEDDILSTYWAPGKANQYAYLAGTSMATPAVAGGVALLLALGLSPQAAVDRILSTVDTRVSCGGGSSNCHGLLNLAAAVGGGGAATKPVTRVAGADRVATAVAISTLTFPAAASAQAAVLARDDAYADALTGVPLAASSPGPLLLNPTGQLDGRVGAELTRVLPRGATVYLLGGGSALSSAVESAVASLGFQPRRIAGPDRFATAVAVANQMGNPTTVFEATGTDSAGADALCAGAPAAVKRGAVLLTNGGAQHPATAAYLAAHGGTRYAIGGPAAQADGAATPVRGSDRFDTCAKVAALFSPTPKVAAIADGLNPVDALAGGTALAMIGGPVLLVDRNHPGTLPATVSSYLAGARSTMTSGLVLGGAGAVPDSTASAFGQAIG